VVEALRVQRGNGEEVDLDAGAGVADDEAIFLADGVAEDFGEIEDRDQAFGLAVLVGDDGVAGLPVGAAGEPCVDIARLELVLVLEEFGEEGVASAQTGCCRCGCELAELGGVDVDDDLVGFAREVMRSVAGDGHVETYAEERRKSQFCRAKLAPRAATCAGTTDVGGIVGGNEVGGAPGGDGGDAEELAELFKLLVPRGRGGCRCRRRAAGRSDCVEGFSMKRGRLPRDIGGAVMEMRRSCELGGVEAAQVASGDGRWPGRRGDVDPDWTGAAVQREPDGFFEVVADVERARVW
jgi:hypothetical protein